MVLGTDLTNLFRCRWGDLDHMLSSERYRSSLKSVVIGFSFYRCDANAYMSFPEDMIDVVLARALRSMPRLQELGVLKLLKGK